MKYNLKYRQFSERSILIVWPSKIDEIILQDVLFFKEVIQNKYIKLKLQVNNTYNSILIIYPFVIENINGKFLELKALYNSSKSIKKLKSTVWEIPVCYDDEFGFDLELLSKEKSLSKAEIIQRHSQPFYTIFFIGFLPGFLYLGGLDKSLHFSRKSTPNLNIKKGAVGIGGNQTGIYPKNSPGGWHIIGNSPVDFFDLKSDEICFAKPGDKIKFQSISKSEFSKISNDIKDGAFRLKSYAYD
ncbi:5-oxoprolinase subunit PxpB [Winogradskyella litorisediminis]|uniref:5-oxoprolinase subunit PxpB n=1 Tax=Winogradskyella litorisediminis TaxID=1156618 RepID=A0ABW3N7N4_9FLAO